MKVHIHGDMQCLVCQTWFTQPSLDCHYKNFHPHLYVAKENRTDIQLHQCHVCEFASSDETRLSKKIDFSVKQRNRSKQTNKIIADKHMKVHAGNVKCPICHIRFTKPSLVYHYQRSHPNLAKKERILKSIENSVLKKVLCHSTNAEIHLTCVANSLSYRISVVLNAGKHSLESVT